MIQWLNMLLMQLLHEIQFSNIIIEKDSIEMIKEDYKNNNEIILIWDNK